MTRKLLHNKKGLLLENLLIGIVVFGLLITIFVSFYSSMSAKYPTMQYENESKFNGISSQVEDITGRVGEIENKTLTSQLTDSTTAEDSLSKRGGVGVATVWDAGRTTKNVTNSVFLELLSGGDDAKSSEISGLISKTLSLIVGISVIFTLIYLFLRFKMAS